MGGNDQRADRGTQIAAAGSDGGIDGKV